jgi:hypothetical protein
MELEAQPSPPPPVPNKVVLYGFKVGGVTKLHAIDEAGGIIEVGAGGGGGAPAWNVNWKGGVAGTYYVDGDELHPDGEPTYDGAAEFGDAVMLDLSGGWTDTAKITLPQIAEEDEGKQILFVSTLDDNYGFVEGGAPPGYPPKPNYGGNGSGTPAGKKYGEQYWGVSGSVILVPHSNDFIIDCVNQGYSQRMHYPYAGAIAGYPPYDFIGVVNGGVWSSTLMAVWEGTSGRWVVSANSRHFVPTGLAMYA